ncbi:hypothetical protein V2O64_23605 [Verrucomicrobiaceae bacterium 227]
MLAAKRERGGIGVIEQLKQTLTLVPGVMTSSGHVGHDNLKHRSAEFRLNGSLGRLHQIRSGFIFEKSVKESLIAQGFYVTDITRINRKEFDVVATLDNVIYNVQCKNNLIDLSKIEGSPKLFARYNRRLERAYEAALLKEENRENLLKEKLGLSDIKHFVLSRFPIATTNPRVLAFLAVDQFRQCAVR